MLGRRFEREKREKVKFSLIKKVKNKEVKMAGTKAGGIKAAKSNKERHGEDFYSRIGRRGGSRGHTGGFYANRELARIAGAIGGKKSKRGPAKKLAN